MLLRGAELSSVLHKIETRRVVAHFRLRTCIPGWSSYLRGLAYKDDGEMNLALGARFSSTIWP